MIAQTRLLARLRRGASLAARGFRTSGNVTDLSVAAFGASTDVGKTIICAGMCRAALARGQRVAYIKPVQTGQELDEYFVREYTNPEGNKDIVCETIFRRNAPPITALNEDKDITDEQLRRALHTFLSQFHATSKDAHSFTVIETAGGVLSPGPSSALQADLYRPFRHPVVLVGDTRLGGITSTLTALEALMLRGFSVHAICLILQPGATALINTEVIRRYSHPSIPIYQFSPLPTDRLLHVWFRDNEQKLHDMFTTLWADVQQELSDMRDAREKAHDLLWWEDCKDGFKDGSSFVESSYGDLIKTVEFAEDGSVSYRNQLYASVLAQGVGAGNRGMALTLAHAAGRYGQMVSCGMYPANVTLADRLVNATWGPGYGWANRVMFADNASDALECAARIAQCTYQARRSSSNNATPSGQQPQRSQRKQQRQQQPTKCSADPSKLRILSISQHLCVGNYGLTAPILAWRYGSLHIDVAALPGVEEPASCPDSTAGLFDWPARLEGPLTDAYRRYIWVKLQELGPFAALLVQPVATLSDQLRFVDPLFQKVLVQECRARGMIIISDEIMTGLWRLGRVSSIDYLGEQPDIAIHGRLMTGGYVDQGIVLTTEEVFHASYDFVQRKFQALNPLSAMAGLEVLQQYRTCTQYDPDTNTMLSPWPEHEVKQLSQLPGVVSSMSLGHVLLVELQQPSARDDVVRHLRRHNIHVHAQGNTVTILVTPMTPPDVCESLLQMLKHVLARLE